MKSTKSAAKKTTAKQPASKLSTGAEHLARVRQICLALRDTMEKISHGEPTFFVHKRVFCMFANNHHNDGHIAVWIPTEPGQQAILLKESAEKYFYPPYVGKGGWIGIELPRISDDELGAHLSDAWRLIETKMIEAKQTKPKRKEKPG
jgi:hypothetical protein